MKNILLVLILCTQSVIAISQNKAYEVYYDNPSPSWFVLNLDFFQLDVAESVSSANFGAWGYINLTEKLAIDYLVEKSYYTSLKKGNPESPWNFDLELGASFTFLSIKASRKIKVQLDYQDNGSSSTTTTTIKIPGTKLNQIAGRGGIIYKRNPYSHSGEIRAQNRTGIYGGLNYIVSKNLAAKVQGYGRRRETGAHAFYADIILAPMHSISDINLSPTSKKGAFGYRLGFEMFETETDSNGGGASLAYALQVGSRPYSGFFITFGIGLSLPFDY